MKDYLADLLAADAGENLDIPHVVKAQKAQKSPEKSENPPCGQGSKGSKGTFDTFDTSPHGEYPKVEAVKSAVMTPDGECPGCLEPPNFQGYGAWWCPNCR